MTTTQITGEITNECTCVQEDGEPQTYCYGDCWEYSVEDFTNVTEDLRKANDTDYWKVENIRLWNRNVSGHFHADKVEDMLRGMAVNGSWTIRYTIFEDRIEYSLSHHDAPMGSTSVLRPMTEEEYEEVRW